MYERQHFDGEERKKAAPPTVWRDLPEWMAKALVNTPHSGPIRNVITGVLYPCGPCEAARVLGGDGPCAKWVT